MIIYCMGLKVGHGSARSNPTCTRCNPRVSTCTGDPYPCPTLRMTRISTPRCDTQSHSARRPSTTTMSSPTGPWSIRLQWVSQFPLILLFPFAQFFMHSTSLNTSSKLTGRWTGLQTCASSPAALSCTITLTSSMSRVCCRKQGAHSLTCYSFLLSQWAFIQIQLIKECSIIWGMMPVTAAKDPLQ